MISIADNIKSVSLRIQNATKSAGRQQGEVCLLAVSKTHPAEAIRAAHQNGLQHFGENYLQEALGKIETLRNLNLIWHFIGPLQSNKTRPVAESFQWVHTLDRPKIARRLAEQRPSGLPPLNVCLQVNIDNESSKSGVTPTDVTALAAEVNALPNLTLRGLMCIPDPDRGTEHLRKCFRQMRLLKDELHAKYPSIDTLSMGMSQDLELAIAEGATIVRVGTAIFGARTYPSKVQ